MTKKHIIPTVIAATVGLIGLLIVLYAWHLPPFHAAHPRTENAYVRGPVTTLAPQLSGYIAAVEVKDFQNVRAGQVIARIDDRQYRQKLAQAESMLASAEAALKIQEQNVISAEARARSAEAALRSAEAARETARSNWNRVSELQVRGVTPQSSADQTLLELRQAEAAVDQAQAAIAVAREDVNGARVGLAARKAEIQSATAAVELARIDLSNTQIRAPSDGRLGQVTVRLGQYVTAGTSLVSHVSHDVWVIANLKETQLYGIRIGDRASFTVDAMHHREFTGVVESFSPAAQSEFSLLPPTNSTGNFTKIAQRLPVRIRIDPGQEMADQLAPGMSVVATIYEGTARRNGTAPTAPSPETAPATAPAPATQTSAAPAPAAG